MGRPQPYQVADAVIIPAFLAVLHGAGGALLGLWPGWWHLGLVWTPVVAWRLLGACLRPGPPAPPRRPVWRPQ